MNRNDFEENVSNLWLFIFLLAFEVGMIIWTWSFKSSDLVQKITNDDSLNTISRAFKIIQLDGYYPHLFLGVIWIFILLGLVLYSFKQKKYIGIIVYILYIIVFWLVFWDPILTSFLIIGSLGTAAIYSSNN